MRLRNWTWHWAWAAFLEWSLNPVLDDTLTAKERWEVVAWSLWPGIKHHYLRPAETWLQRHLPSVIAIGRLEHQGAGWYRVPYMPAALHLWRRLGVYVLEGDFVRIERGAVTMKGYADDDLHRCEFWYVNER